MGSPPHTREEFVDDIVILSDSRITPAYAGRIIQDTHPGGYDEDHPRIRGKNQPLKNN